jgi:hypothetical protein
MEASLLILMSPAPTFLENMPQAKDIAALSLSSKFPFNNSIDDPIRHKVGIQATSKSAAF